MTELTERERQIVAWLRVIADCPPLPTDTGQSKARAICAAFFANAIERGEPWGEQA